MNELIPALEAKYKLIHNLSLPASFVATHLVAGRRSGWRCNIRRRSEHASSSSPDPVDFHPGWSGLDIYDFQNAYVDPAGKNLFGSRSRKPPPFAKKTPLNKSSARKIRPATIGMRGRLSGEGIAGRTAIRRICPIHPPARSHHAGGRSRIGDSISRILLKQHPDQYADLSPASPADGW